MYEKEIEALQKVIEDSNHIVFFGGAGVSTESGIPDFRSAAGLFHQNSPFPPEQVVSKTFFHAFPEVFFDFYRSKLLVLGVHPNAAHTKLAELEEKGKVKKVITQNIDGLHQQAGSKQVIELHGSIHRNYCLTCRAFFDASVVEGSEGIPRCSCGGIIKPDVVLYEEELNVKTIRGAVQAIASADALMIGGTSLAVYPAAGFIDYFQGKHLVVINKSELGKHVRASLRIRAPIGEIFAGIHV